jgi:uncharacterized ion transporter superfamily protein YfcC
MSVISDIFLHSFVRGAGKTVGAFLIVGIAGSVWYVYSNQEKRSLFKKPKIVIKSKKNENDDDQQGTVYSDIEQIDNENEFDNSKIRELFDSLL